MRLTIQPNAHVTLAYTLRNASGELLDASDGEGGEPIEYIHGYGMIVAGLEAALVGLGPGDKKEVRVAAEDGFGLRDEELVVDIDRSELPDPAKVTIGDELVAEDSDGDQVLLRVIAVEADSVRVDANHPLAGQTLHYSVEITAVRPATDTEIAGAAKNLDDVLSEVGAESDPMPLIPLGKKPSAKLLN